VQLMKRVNNVWRTLNRVNNATATTTVHTGFIDTFSPFEYGYYRLSYATGPAIAAMNFTTIFPSVDITFGLFNSTREHNILLLLAPQSYSTYLGWAAR
ncbi:unnamed protein product, partial [Diamesa tonsa]